MFTFISTLFPPVLSLQIKIIASLPLPQGSSQQESNRKMKSF